MNICLKRFGWLVTGFYAWVMAVFLGGVLLDMAYANTLRNVISAPEREAEFSNVSDALLCMGGVIIPAGLGAIAASWKSGAARNLFAASLLLVIFEFITPVLFSAFAGGAQDVRLGPWLRIIPAGLGSLLAFAGVFYFYRQSGYRGES